MKATKQFIEDAIEGGWHKDQKFRLAAGYIKFTTTDADGFLEKIPVAEALLDPKFWEAVGKTRGWGDMHDYPDNVYEAWDTFFYQLYNGDSVEEALSAITN